jgi:hypothetical protein
MRKASSALRRNPARERRNRIDVWVRSYMVVSEKRKVHLW